MKSIFKPPLTGGEFTQVVDTGAQQVPPNASRVRLIPVGDGESGRLLPSSMKQKRHPSLLPSTEEIGELPLRAQFALTARCLRRVITLLDIRQENQSKINSGELKQAAELLEQSATQVPPSTTADIILLVEQVVQNLAAIHGRSITRSDLRLDNIHFQVRTATSEVTAILADFGLPLSHLSVVRNDFDRIARLAKLRDWTNETPIYQEVFGPLWPKGFDLERLLG